MVVVPVSRLKLILKPLPVHPPQLLAENWVRPRPDILLTLSPLLLAWAFLAPQNKVQQFPSIFASCDSEHCAFPSSVFWLWRQKTDSGHGWFFSPIPPLQCVGSRARQEHFSTMGSRVHSTSQLWMAANWRKRESLLVAESHCRIA